MNQKNKVLVKINGQEYPIVGAEPKEYLLKVGSFVDDNMESVAKANNRLSTSMIAVLTCINISDQYLKLKSALEEMKKELMKPQEKINELEVYIESMQEIELSQEDDEQVHLLRNQLKDKENDLEKAQTLINDLQNKLFDNQIKLVQAIKELEDYTVKNSPNKNNRDFRGK